MEELVVILTMTMFAVAGAIIGRITAHDQQHEIPMTESEMCDMFDEVRSICESRSMRIETGKDAGVS